MGYKVVYNTCYGGFGVSNEGMKLYIEKKGYTPKLYEGKYTSGSHWYIEKPWDCHPSDLVRHDPILVEVVEELGEKSWGDFAKLAVEEVSGLYRIEEYDGNERLITYPDYYDWLDPSKG